MKEKKNKLWIVFLILGICFVLGGISLIITGVLQKVPQMGEANWFESSSSKGFKIAIGGFITFVSIILFTISGVIKQTTKSPEEKARMFANIVDKQKRYEEELNRLGVDASPTFNNNLNNKKSITCSYCGCEYSDNKCPNCGATNKK